MSFPLPAAPSPTSLRRPFALLALALIAPVAGCGGAAAAFGSSPAAARSNAEALFEALARRFSPVRRDERLLAIRPKYVRSALSPSRIFDDTSIWTGTAPNTRILTVVGGVVGGRYTLSVRAQHQPPTSLGDTRAVMSVRRVVKSVYRWESRNEIAAGDIRAAEIIGGIVAALATAERRDAEEIRSDYRRSLPRATAMLGRLFSLDTLRATTFRDGATAVKLGISLHPERLRAELPHFADYLDAYVQPARYRFSLLDRSGARWLDAGAERNRIDFAFRVRDGMLVPLDGPPRPLPDTLLFRGEFFVKAGIFTVGVTDLAADLMPMRGERQKGFAMRFREEPDWHFPLAAERLISASLHRPFEGQGVSFSLFAEDRPGAPTLIARELGITVQESAIIRWLGRFGATAMNDVTATVEEERDRWVGEVFRALRSDLAAGLPAGSGDPAP